MNEKPIFDRIPRPPIVVVMGHIDHGKSTLIDFIRKTNITAKEAGGITQSIGAYEIEHPSTSSGQAPSADSTSSPQASSGQAGKKITFIDTPGHEAFSRMRVRGARVADLAILVVASDDGVKPQTKEVIATLNETNTPFIVAINKIDKNNSDPERVKNELAQAGVLLEGYGGNVSWQGISAKTGEGVNELLDLILLAAELEGLTYDPEALPQGIILEARMDSRRGLAVTAIIKEGCLKLGDEIKTRSASGKVKMLENFLGKKVDKLCPSSPVLIVGFNEVPNTGEIFYDNHFAMEEEKSKETKIDQVPHRVAKENEDAVVHLFLKADVSGSLEALSQIVKAMPDVSVIHESIGEINDGDVKNAASNEAIIIGFNVSPSKVAENVAKSQSVTIITSKIIYELVKKLEEQIQSLKLPKPDGELTILAVFNQKGKKQLIGGRVSYGIMKNNSKVKIGRGEEEIGVGRIVNLQKGKQEAKEVGEGEECGVMFESDVLINVGDRLVYQP